MTILASMRSATTISQACRSVSGSRPPSKLGSASRNAGTAPLSVALLHVSGLKVTNDPHGYDAGDRLLAVVTAEASKPSFAGHYAVNELAFALPIQ